MNKIDLMEDLIVEAVEELMDEYILDEAEAQALQNLKSLAAKSEEELKKMNELEQHEIQSSAGRTESKSPQIET